MGEAVCLTNSVIERFRSRNCIYYWHKLSGRESLNTWLGEGEEVCLTNGAIERFRSLTKEMNHTKNWWRRHKSKCRNGGRPH